MIETELKISLDAVGEARLARHAGLRAMRAAPRRSKNLVSVYYDTPDHALAGAGIALRLRRDGRRWLQTIKCRTDAGSASGLFANREIEQAAPGGRLVLKGADPVFAAIAEARGDAALAPVFETRVRRIVERLCPPGGGEVELAIDRGEIVAGERRSPILEAELELITGDVGAVYALARCLFHDGPVRFADANKSARGYALARGEVEPETVKPRMAGSLDYAPEASVESVARDVLRDCFAQIAGNLAVVADSDMPEGPHQLRVGLRRLRSALGLFKPYLGAAQADALNATARDLGRQVSGLRDLDVLIGDVEKLAEGGLDRPARDALIAVLDDRRRALRGTLRRALAAPEIPAFLFDLARFIEARGWLVPADFSQSARLATPIAEAAPALLAKRYRKVRKLARGLEELDHDALHALRKELKKLRYGAEMLAPIYPGRKVADYLRRLKDLQDSFGSLTDAAMADGLLTGAAAPGRAKPEVQRATGWVLGCLSVTVADDRPRIFERWRVLTEARPFWT